jgi:hypothetical protein
VKKRAISLEEIKNVFAFKMNSLQPTKSREKALIVVFGSG